MNARVRPRSCRRAETTIQTTSASTASGHTQPNASSAPVLGANRCSVRRGGGRRRSVHCSPPLCLVWAHRLVRSTTVDGCTAIELCSNGRQIELPLLDLGSCCRVGPTAEYVANNHVC